MGINAVVAGGAIRDKVRGVSPEDIDVWLLGDTSNVNPDVLASLLMDAKVFDNDDSDYFDVRVLVKGYYVDSTGVNRKVDIIIPWVHYNNAIELVGTFDYNINQGFVGIDCGFYQPDLSELRIINPERTDPERTARFRAMVQYYNDQEAVRQTLANNKAH